MNRLSILLLSLSAIFIFVGCNESNMKQVVYKGSDKEAIINNLLTRRSIRKYTDQQIGPNLIDTIMKCAIYAPSALNKQPWEIRVVQNPAIVEEFNKRFITFAEGKEMQGSASKYREPEFSITHHAPTVVVIASDKSNPYAILDSGIAVENILLSSHALGVGTCTIGSLVPVLNNPDNSDLLDLLNIPDGYQVTITIAMGYAAESPEAPIRYTDKVKIIQ